MVFLTLPKPFEGAIALLTEFYDHTNIFPARKSPLSPIKQKRPLIQELNSILDGVATEL